VGNEFPEPLKNAGKFRIASALASYGQLERAVAVSYEIEPIGAQAFALREVVTQAARTGREAAAKNLANSLASADGWIVPQAMGRAVQVQQEARRPEAVIRGFSGWKWT
jgi:hypothetical protein